MVGAIWSVLTWPFRLIGWALEGVGRLVGVAIGFVLMVAGAALFSWLWLLGLPTFVIGLLIALRCLR